MIRYASLIDALRILRVLFRRKTRAGVGLLPSINDAGARREV